MDGVTRPACTGAMLSPYFANVALPRSRVGRRARVAGPTVIPRTVLHPLLIEAARAGLEPHMHADGDRAVREAARWRAALRSLSRERDSERPSHTMRSFGSRDFPLHKHAGVTVLSFQWEKPAPDTIDGAAGITWGRSRLKYLEPAGYLGGGRCAIAYGSHWPVDPLNEWFALKVAVTRENDPAAGEKYAGRLSSDTGTHAAGCHPGHHANSSYELHAEHEVGSLEVGKLADFIVLDRNVLQDSGAAVADVKVLLTVVGGKAVYGAAPFAVAN